MSAHVQQLLAHAREEELASDERVRVEAHLTACAACRSFEIALQHNDAALSEHELVSRLPDLRPRAARSLPPIMGIASIGIATVVLGVALGAALGQSRVGRSNPSALQSQAATTPEASAAQIPRDLVLAPGSPSSGFGLLSTQANELLVRSEPSSDPRIVLPNTLANVAVAPNGHSVALWRRGDVTNNQFGWSLHVLDAIDGRIGPALLTTTDEVPYGQPRWSSDGGGLIVGTQTPVVRGDRPGGTTHNSWFAIDLSTQAVSRLGTLEASLATIVYAWDRQRDLITAAGVIANADRFTYVVVSAGTAEIFQLPPQSAISAADAYARSMVIAGVAACSGQASPGVDCVHLEIHDQASFSTVTTLPPVPISVQRLLGVVFRPRSQDLIVSVIEPNGTVRDELWSDLGRGPHRVLATSPGANDRAAVTGVIPRVDGSAALILRFDPSGTGRWHGVLASLSDTTRTPFEITSGGNPLASVVLDRAFARELEK